MELECRRQQQVTLPGDSHPIPVGKGLWVSAEIPSFLPKNHGFWGGCSSQRGSCPLFPESPIGSGLFPAPQTLPSPLGCSWKAPELRAGPFPRRRREGGRAGDGSPAELRAPKPSRFSPKSVGFKGTSSLPLLPLLLELFPEAALTSPFSM